MGDQRVAPCSTRLPAELQRLAHEVVMDVSVALRRARIAMAQHPLHDLEPLTGLEQFGTPRVPQLVEHVAGLAYLIHQFGRFADLLS
jgi:hypothetical protein